jgi:dihydropteroate synthase/2-amino-4-hydroxy-6-hydroxymethyldihydropteridine diphosphokinase
MVYLALGTNLGDRRANLIGALRALAGRGLTVTALSRVYETEPAYVTDQPRFLNMVVQADTALEPLAVLDMLKALEADLGRAASVRYGPRLIDLDLLLAGDQVVGHERLTLPHPRLHERAFVLVPLAELAADVVIPGRGTVGEALAALGEVGDQIWLAGEQLPSAWQTAPELVRGAFVWGARTYVMGILNVTPDSFSGDGLIGAPDADAVARAVGQAEAMAAAGAHVLDVGGESTRPGGQPVSLESELARVIPVVQAIAARVPLPLSIDTYKSEVARQALAAGATMINDVWGFKMDPGMAGVARDAAWAILMHNRSRPRDAAQEARLGGRYVGVAYDDLLADISRELGESVALARAAGIPDARLILDPGIGFGKTVAQNLELVDRLGELRLLGFPLLAGPSRKSFIGYTLNLPAEERLEGTAAVVAVCIARGADLVRVHDVAALVRVARMTDAVVRR